MYVKLSWSLLCYLIPVINTPWMYFTKNLQKRGIINDFRWHFAYLLIIYCKNIIRPFLFIFFSRTTTSGDWVDWHTNRHLHSAGNCTRTIIFINALCYINHLTNTQYINLFYLDVFLKKKFIPLKKNFFLGKTLFSFFIHFFLIKCIVYFCQVLDIPVYFCAISNADLFLCCSFSSLHEYCLCMFMYLKCSLFTS